MTRLLFIIVFGLTTPFVSGQTSDTSFVSFWTNFHSDIVAKNYKALSVKTKFPLKAKGELDYDTIDECGSKDFEKVFSKFLLADVNPGHPQTRYDWLKTFKLKPSLDKKAESSIRIDDMVFKKINGKWWLTLIYDGHSKY